MAGYGQENINIGQEQDNRGFFSKILRDLSSWGMDYQSQVAKNAVGVGVNTSPSEAKSNDLYSLFSRHAVGSLMDKKNIAFFDKSYPEKRRLLREYARKNTIRDYVTKVTDEVIVYDDLTRFCEPVDLGEEFEQRVRDKVTEHFDKIYHLFGFDNGITAWNHFKRFLVDGILAFEIIYDNKRKNIIGFQMLDPITLVPGVDPVTNSQIWIQFPDSPKDRKILLDSQVIYISYSNTNDFTETSYVEPLIRPYNQITLMEQTRIMFNIINASAYKKFIVPVGGLSKSQAEEQIAKLIMDYKDEVSWDDNMGTLSINGSPHIPYSKEYWFPEGEGGTPSVELINQQGVDLNEDSMLVYFRNILKKESKLPMTRFDETGGGGNYNSDLEAMTREEMSFFNFTTRLRTVFKEILVKPLINQMVLEFPELKNDSNFRSKINVIYSGVNLYYSKLKRANLLKSAEAFSTLSSSLQDLEGKPILHPKWLIKHILEISEEDLEENARYFMMDKKNGVEGAEGGEVGIGGADFGGGDVGGDLGGDMGSEPAPEPAAEEPAPEPEAPAEGGGDTLEF